MGQFLPKIRNVFKEIKKNKKRLEKKVEQEDPQIKKVQLFKSRILQYENPVEYVNNMYGCHPSEGGRNYFDIIYGDEGNKE